MRHILIMVAALTIAIPGALYVNLTGVEAAPRYAVSVWYPGWGTSGVSDYQSISRNLRAIDEINPYWYALKGDGSVAPYDWAEVPRLLSLARKNNKRVMPLISNEFDPARVSRMLATKSSRNAHARELTRLVVDKRYAGLDLDYEMLYAKDRDRFSLFVRRLAYLLRAKGKKLSVTVHPKTSAPGSWSGARAQDWRRIGRVADEVKIMTYDYHWDGSRAGPAAPPRWIDKVLTHAERTIPPRKVRMGLPFYGRDWRGTSAKDLVYADVHRLKKKYSPTVRRRGGEPYFRYPGRHTVYYQDRRSIGIKLRVLVRKHPRIGGIAIWHVGGEAPGYWGPIKNRLNRG